MSPDKPLRLDAPIEKVAGGWASRSLPALKEGLGLRTIGDLLHHYPRDWIDRSKVVPIRELKVNQTTTVLGHVKKVHRVTTRNRKVMVTVQISDGTATLNLFWFNQSWPLRKFREGQEVAASGKLSAFGGHLRMQNPQVEVLKGGEDDLVHTSRIVPMHRSTEGTSAGIIRRLVWEALQGVGEDVPDPIPPDVIERGSLPTLGEALNEFHFPQDERERDRARERLKFDELFFLEVGVAFRKHRVEAATEGIAHDLSGDLAERFLAALPFELTDAQRSVTAGIAKDMAVPKPMNRLLQGDVGSGKTVVALHAAMVAIQSGHQAAIMAPTEVLAGQHLRKVEELLAPLDALRVGPERAKDQPDLFGGTGDGPRFAFLAASVTGKERERVKEGVANGEVDLLIGTHALVQEGVEFHDLSLAVVDEQHRFGLHQRIALKEKGVQPDMLIMTATPIPRTLALTYYGDLDVSVLDEMPAGRQPIETRLVRTPQDRAKAYELVREQVTDGRQAFVVCAAIDEDNRLEVKAAETEAERLATEVFPDLRIALLHGKMRPKIKEETMEAFRAGERDLLIATTVIEVGVDIPNATVMLVENAERFGLAQLHQLRGRIGRGAHLSYCFLFDESEPENEVARERLAAMVRTTDGFLLADEDLRLRGEGTLFDVKQSGMPDLRLARLAHDLETVKRARKEAFRVIEEDPELAEHPELRAEMERRFADSIDWLFHS